MISDRGPQPTHSPLARPVVVMKFGGTSVGTVARIQRVAQLALSAHRAGQGVVVVVSAMSGETNRLLGLASEIATVGGRRERDVLVASGEQVTAALTALAINTAGGRARPFLGHQLRILTDGTFGDARVQTVETAKLDGCLAAGEIPVVAGFQGVDADGNITTLGRGGSDTTAVALAAALGAASCEIYTDVDGVYTADPNVCSNARKLASVPYQQMLTLASLGAKVLHDRSVEMAMEHRVAVHVRSSFADTPGTWLTVDGAASGLSVAGLACDRNMAHVLLKPTATRSELEAMLTRLAAAGIHATGIFGEKDMPSFTLRAVDAAEAREVLTTGDLPLAAIEDVARVSIVGSRLLDAEATLLAKVERLVEACGVRLDRLAATATAISLLVARAHADQLMRTLHDGLDVGTSPEHTMAPASMRYGRDLAD